MTNYYQTFWFIKNTSATKLQLLHELGQIETKTRINIKTQWVRSESRNPIDIDLDRLDRQDRSNPMKMNAFVTKWSIDNRTQCTLHNYELSQLPSQDFFKRVTTKWMLVDYPGSVTFRGFLKYTSDRQRDRFRSPNTRNSVIALSACCTMHKIETQQTTLKLRS